jgi:protein MpaA
MTTESTPPTSSSRYTGPDSGEPLLAAVAERAAGLGLAEITRSRRGRPVFAGELPMGAAHTRAPLVLMAGIHGNEGSSVGAVLDLLDRWSEVRPAARVIVVPALNPDGLLLNVKNGATDVDLNRNFAARNFTTVHAPGYDPGPAPLSEPETAAFAALIDSVRPWGVVAIHAPFACINYDGGAPAAPWAQAVAAACGWPARADIGYPTPGSLGSWLGVDRGLPVLTIELPPGPLHQFRDAAFVALAAAVSWEETGDLDRD